MHVPYHNKKLLPALYKLKTLLKPDLIISIGDEIDQHAMSYHEHDPDLASAGDELRKAKKVITDLHKLFPEMKLLESNHGSLAYRKAKTVGMPKDFLKSYQDVLGVDKGWSWHDDLIVDLPNKEKVYFDHGMSSQANRLSDSVGCNTVEGHYHGKFQISYKSGPLGVRWSMHVGCLIDEKSLAFAYGRKATQKPVIGLGAIINSQPMLIPLDMVKDETWLKKAILKVW